jgi:CRISPR/Cas system-associated protein Cas10 (large subunit of type III CRISPR-Cas system)
MKISNKQLKKIIQEELENTLEEELDSRLGLDTGIGQGSFTKADPLERIINARRELELAIKSMEKDGDAFRRTDSSKDSFAVRAALGEALEILEQASKTEYFKGF